MSLIEQGEHKRDEILLFLSGFITKNGYSPSMQEVGTAIGSHKNGARHHLLRLQKDGAITMAEGSYRSIRLTEVGERRVQELSEANA
jgi:SOS-response transcriptional repressor LexA